MFISSFHPLPDILSYLTSPLFIRPPLNPQGETDADEFAPGRVRKRLSSHLKEILLFVAVSLLLCLLSQSLAHFSFFTSSVSPSAPVMKHCFVGFSFKKTSKSKSPLSLPSAFSLFVHTLLYSSFFSFLHINPIVISHDYEHSLYLFPPRLQSLNTRLH